MRNDSAKTRAHGLRDAFDGSPLAGRVAPLEQNHDSEALLLDPSGQLDQFDLQAQQFELVVRPRQLG